MNQWIHPAPTGLGCPILVAQVLIPAALIHGMLTESLLPGDRALWFAFLLAAPSYVAMCASMVVVSGVMEVVSIPSCFQCLDNGLLSWMGALFLVASIRGHAQWAMPLEPALQQGQT